MIRIRQLTKHVGADRIPVLRGIDVDIHTGEFVGLVGPSGSGKSMLLRCLSMKETWNSGSLIIEGKDMLQEGYQGKQTIKREWAYLEQNPYVQMNRSALKNVLIGRAGQTPLWRMITGMIRSDDYMGAMDTLEHLGLLDKAHNKCEKLSGGERQRVAIARAMVHGAKVILADEPVNGLDPASADRVLETFRQLCKEQKLTVIAVLPLELAEKYATRIWGLQQGEVVLDVYDRRLTYAEKNLL